MRENHDHAPPNLYHIKTSPARNKDATMDVSDLNNKYIELHCKQRTKASRYAF